jgi:hypothetical protein
MTSDTSRPDHRPFVPVTFKGDLSEDERDTIREALQDGEAHMPATLKRRLKSTWLAKVTHDSEMGRYFAVHRLGIGVAFTGRSAEDIARQIRSRWPAPDSIG